MNNNDLVKKIYHVMDVINTIDEVQKWTKELNNFRNFKRNIAILKLVNKINKEDIDLVTSKLIFEFNRKYGTNYKYDGDYIKSISLIENDIEELISKKIQDKLNEKSIETLLEGVFNNNE